MVSWHKLVIPLNTNVSRLISIDIELGIYIFIQMSMSGIDTIFDE